jgi:hypothetical protein
MENTLPDCGVIMSPISSTVSTEGKRFYAAYLQPSTLKQFHEKHSNEPIGTLNWFPHDEMELSHLKADGLKTGEKETPSQLIGTIDNPNNRIKLSKVKQIFSPPLESLETAKPASGWITKLLKKLETGKPRDGWLAQMLDVVSLDNKQAQSLLEHKGTQLIPYGAYIPSKPLDPELLNKRLKLEGFADLQQVKTEWQKLFQAKASYLKKEASELKGREHYIQALHDALQHNKPLEFDGNKHSINRNLLSRELLKQMVYLHTQQTLNDSLKNPYTGVLDNLHKKHGLELHIKEPTIIGRQMKGIVLTAPQLNLVIKQPGDVISHSIIHTPSNKLQNIDPIGLKEAVIHGPAIQDQAHINTSRGQIEDRIKQNMEALSRDFGVPTHYSLIAGIETQKMIHGKSVKTVLSEKPELLTKSWVQKLVAMHEKMEKAGLELTDWSFNKFMIPNEELKTINPKILLADFGGFKPIPVSMQTEKHTAERRRSIENIGNSVSNLTNQQAITRPRMTAYLAEIELSNVLKSIPANEKPLNQ